MKVVHHIKSLGFGGTEKVAMTFCKYLAEDPDYEVYLIYPENGDLSRLPYVSPKIHLVPYQVEYGSYLGIMAPYVPESSNFFDLLDQIDPDILHVHRSGYYEWPIIKRLPYKVVETNIFGYADHSGYVDKHIYIANFIRNSALNAGNPHGPILYNPIESPTIDGTLHNLMCDKLGLSNNSILLGRIGRADNFDPIALQTFKIIRQEFPNTYYCIVGLCENAKRFIDDENIEGVIEFDPLISDNEVYGFLRSIDIYAHYRSDGECNSVAIGEAMLHGLPIVSHYGHTYNGHAEQLMDCGFIVPRNDVTVYTNVLRELIENISLRKEMGQKAQKRGERMHDPLTNTTQLKHIYEEVLFDEIFDRR